MTDETGRTVQRRQFLYGVAATGVTSGVAGCSSDESDDTPGQGGGGGGDGDGGDGGGGDGGDGGGSDGSDTTPTETEADPATPAETASDRATPTEDEQTSSGSDGVAVDVSLSVRSSRSNVDRFETLRTTFEALELVSAGGDTIRLDDATRDIDLTEVGPGGSVDLFETTIPAGAYTEATLYLPIQEATLADGGDPEFERTASVSREVRGDPIEIESSDGVTLNVTVALLRIAGDGPWTYTLGWGIQ